MSMMFGVARIGRDAEVRYTQGGDPVASISLAFSYGKKGADGKRPTQWVEASLWGARAESLAQYLVKGQQVAVTLEDVHLDVYRKRDQSEGVKMVGRVSSLEFAGGGQQASQQQERQTRQAAPAYDDDENIPF